MNTIAAMDRSLSLYQLLARMEGQITFSALLRRFSGISLTNEPLQWRENLGLRGLRALPLHFQPRREHALFALPASQQLSRAS
jgi:hypothetical protein